MELFGSGYVIDHCVSAFIEKQQSEAWKNYMANGIYAIANMYSVRNGGKAVYEKTYHELFEKPEPEKTAEEVISHIRNGLKGLKKE